MSAKALVDGVNVDHSTLACLACMDASPEKRPYRIDAAVVDIATPREVRLHYATQHDVLHPEELVVNLTYDGPRGNTFSLRQQGDDS